MAKEKQKHIAFASEKSKLVYARFERLKRKLEGLRDCKITAPELLSELMREWEQTFDLVAPYLEEENETK